MDGSVRVRSRRWFATGVAAALAAVLVFGNPWAVDAAPGDTDTTFVPITPCRLADTRTGSGGALGPGATRVFAGHGAVGQCTLPAEAVGLSLNVTALGASTSTYLTIWPGGARPNASSLNPAPGQPPTPNAVSVPLAGDGTFRVYNYAGSVDVIIDVNGYATKASLQVLSAEQPFVSTDRNSGTAIGDVDTTVVDVSLTAPAAGNVTVMSTTTAREDTAGQYVACSITATSVLDTDYLQRWRSPGATGADSQLAGTRVFTVTAGEPVTYRLVCKNLTAGATSDVYDPTIAAIFTPAA